jgi:hypothetical protein
VPDLLRLSLLMCAKLYTVFLHNVANYVYL